jgi:hypothetical protein
MYNVGKIYEFVGEGAFGSIDPLYYLASKITFEIAGREVSIGYYVGHHFFAVTEIDRDSRGLLIKCVYFGYTTEYNRENKINEVLK